MDFGATFQDDTRPRARAVIEILERARDLLQEIASSLPEEAGEDGEVSLRAVIECVLVDRLQPAVQDLRAVVE